MYARLTGVFDRAPGEPAATQPLLGVRAEDLTIARGESGTIEVRVLDRQGAPATLTGATAILTVKRSTAESLGVIAKSVTTFGADGTATFSIDPADTQFLDPLRYLYDVWITQGTARHQAVPVGAFVLKAGVRAPS